MLSSAKKHPEWTLGSVRQTAFLLGYNHHHYSFSNVFIIYCGTFSQFNHLLCMRALIVSRLLNKYVQICYCCLTLVLLVKLVIHKSYESVVLFSTCRRIRRSVDLYDLDRMLRHQYSRMHSQQEQGILYAYVCSTELYVDADISRSVQSGCDGYF